MVYKKTYTDGREYLPFEFILHDIIHYTNFILYCGINEEGKLNKIKSFYDFIDSAGEKSQKDAAKLIFFIQTHENTTCELFNEIHYQSGAIKNEWSPFYTSFFQLRFLLDDNIFGKLVPKEYRKTQDDRLNYLEYSSATYLQALQQFNQQKELFEPTTVLIKPTVIEARGGKKTKKRKSKKTKRKGKKRTKSTNKKLI